MEFAGSDQAQPDLQRRYYIKDRQTADKTLNILTINNKEYIFISFKKCFLKNYLSKKSVISR